MDWTVPEKIPPKVIQVKFLPDPPSSQATETPNSSKPTPMVPARFMAIQPNLKSLFMPRTPNLSNPTLQPVKKAHLMIQSHRKTIKRSLAQPASFAKTKLFPAMTPANTSQHDRQTLIHRRSPTLEIPASEIFDAPTRTAISTGPAKSKSRIIRRLPSPAQSMPLSKADFISQPAVEQPLSKNTTRGKFAALPRELPQIPSVDRDVSDANLNGLRGLFTGKVRQQIANAKYYPRIARRRGLEGQPVIAFTLSKNGRLMKVDLARTSGYQILDQAALETVHRAAPYPEIPAELKTDIFQFKLPISFVLK
jgi:TonB family protein